MKKYIVLIFAILVAICWLGCGGEKDTVSISEANVGNFVKYGNYRGTPIIWKVFDVNQNSKMLVSEYALDIKEYNDKNNKKADWQNSTIRKWLNHDFIDNAFSLEEQRNIVSTKRRENVYDKVFLLSKNEVEGYFTTKEDRKCYPTSYVKENNENVSGSNDCIGYWLDTEERSSETLRIYGKNVYWNYYVDYRGNTNTVLVWSPIIELIAKYGVRPVIWVKTK